MKSHILQFLKIAVVLTIILNFDFYLGYETKATETGCCQYIPTGGRLTCDNDQTQEQCTANCGSTHAEGVPFLGAGCTLYPGADCVTVSGCPQSAVSIMRGNCTCADGTNATTRGLGNCCVSCSRQTRNWQNVTWNSATRSCDCLLDEPLTIEDAGELVSSWWVYEGPTSLQACCGASSGRPVGWRGQRERCACICPSTGQYQPAKTLGECCNACGVSVGGSVSWNTNLANPAHAPTECEANCECADGNKKIAGAPAECCSSCSSFEEVKFEDANFNCGCQAEGHVFTEPTTPEECCLTASRELDKNINTLRIKIQGIEDFPCGPEMLTPPQSPLQYQYTQAVPRLQIPLPTLPGLTEFMSVEPQGEVGNRYLFIPWIGQYIAAIYKYAVGITGILAALMIVIGGLIWLTAGGSAERVSTARGFIENALVGLVIALTSYLLLYAINPKLTEFESLKVKFIERVDLSFGYADPTPEQLTYAAANPPVASGGNTPRDQLLLVCNPHNSGITKEKLLEILPTWVDVGIKGGATYIRGGTTARTGCGSNPQEGYAKERLTEQGISFDPNASKEVLQELYQKEIADKVYAAGKLCGDCVSWQFQLFQCAGMDHRILIPAIKTKVEVGIRWGSITMTEDHPAYYKKYLVASSTQSCGDAASKIPGGLKFGDLFHKCCDGHMVMYTGDAGLPYEIVEMGGGVSQRCEMIPGLQKRLGCVRTTEKKEDWRSWRTVTQYCDIFRIIP